MKPSEVIEKYGHVKGQFGNEQCGFCITGAILHSRFGQTPDELHESGLWMEVLHEVRKQFPASNPDREVNSLAYWNDKAETTKENVLSVLKAVNQ